MQTTDNTLVGHITDISGGRLIATLLTEAEGFEPVMQVGQETLSVGQLGSQLLVVHRDLKLLGQVLRMWEEEAEVIIPGSSPPLQARRARPRFAI